MPLDAHDFEALRLLIREEVNDAITPFREEVNQRFDEVNNSLDVLFTRDQEREREYLVLRNQISA